MSELAPIKLSDDPRVALGEIASYLRSVRIERGRAVHENGEIIGYWQTPEWFDGLAQIEAEAENLS